MQECLWVWGGLVYQARPSLGERGSSLIDKGLGVIGELSMGNSVCDVCVCGGGGGGGGGE